ncbi:MAG: EpsG family protein [Oscillospiraceae bacterium]|nr:EpsG family protein [Oscillospiraceae bacterium]
MIDFFTLGVYSAVFFPAILLFYFSDKHKSKNGKIFFGGLAILMLCLLAGFRANSVGRDINVYVTNNFQFFRSSGSFLGSMKQATNLGLEPLFCLLLYITSRFSGDAWPMLFAMQLMTILPVYLAVLKWNKEKRVPVSFAMAVYIFVLYNNSYNIMRQSMATAFVFLGTTYLLFYTDKNPLKALLFRKDRQKEKWIAIGAFVCAYFLHKSALIGLALVLLAFWLKNKPKRIVVIILIGAIIGFYFLKTICMFLMSKVQLSASFTYYINVFVLQTIKKSWMQDHYSIFMLFDITVRTAVLFIPFLLLRKEDEKEHCLRTMTVLGYIVYALPWITMKTAYGNRIALYTDFFLIILIPLWTREKFSRGQGGRFFISMIMWVYWFMLIMCFKWADAGVYKFRF